MTMFKKNQHLLICDTKLFSQARAWISRQVLLKVCQFRVTTDSKCTNIKQEGGRKQQGEELAVDEWVGVGRGGGGVDVVE